MVHPFVSQTPKLECVCIYIYIFFDIGMLGSNFEVHKLIGHVMGAQPEREMLYFSIQNARGGRER